MYQRNDGPLPPNSRDNSWPGMTGRGLARKIDLAALEGRQRVQQLPLPQSFLELGLPLTKGVTQSQMRMAAANDPYTFPIPAPESVLANSPVQMPLNVSLQEYNGCCTPLYDPAASETQAAPLVRPAVPQAPVGIDTEQGVLYVQQSNKPYTGPQSSPGGLGSSCNRGLGAAWGDAGRTPCGGTWGVRKQASSAGGLVLLGLIGLLVFTD